MFDKIINNESYPYSKRRLKYYSLAFKDAEDKIRNGVNPDDVHKDLIKDLNRVQSINSKTKWIKIEKEKNEIRLLKRFFKNV